MQREVTRRDSTSDQLLGLARHHPRQTLRVFSICINLFDDEQATLRGDGLRGQGLRTNRPE